MAKQTSISATVTRLLTYAPPFPFPVLFLEALLERRNYSRRFAHARILGGHMQAEAEANKTVCCHSRAPLVELVTVLCVASFHLVKLQLIGCAPL